MKRVEPGSFLTLHYRLRDGDGVAFVDTFATPPATLSLGTGELAPAMEARLIGLAAGSAGIVRARRRRSVRRARSRAGASRQPRACSTPKATPTATTASATSSAFPRPTARSIAGVVRDDRRRLAACSTSTIRSPAAGHVRRQVDRRAVMAPAALQLPAGRGVDAGRSRPRRAARLLRRRRPRDRDRRARAPQVRRADLRAPRDRPQHLRRRRPQGARARSSSRTSPTCRRARRSSSARTACRRRCARRRRSAASAIFDATCPLVTKVHVEVAKLHKRGLRLHHDRPQGPSRGRRHDGPARPTASTWSRTSPTSSGSMSPADRPLAVVTQTTLSVDDAAEIMAAVKRRFPGVREPKQQDICYATQNRQDAVKLLAPGVDVLIVVGSPSSVEQQPPARAGRAARRRRLHGRHRRRPARRSGSRASAGSA